MSSFLFFNFEKILKTQIKITKKKEAYQTLTGLSCNNL